MSLVTTNHGTILAVVLSALALLGGCNTEETPTDTPPAAAPTTPGAEAPATPPATSPGAEAPAPPIEAPAAKGEEEKKAEAPKEAEKPAEEAKPEAK